jgi:hypothetical protein
MNNLLVRQSCTVPTELLKTLLFIGIVSGVILSAARLFGLEVPPILIVGLVGFFLAGAVLASHELSILRNPGVVLAVGLVSLVVLVRLQNMILEII